MTSDEFARAAERAFEKLRAMKPPMWTLPQRQDPKPYTIVLRDERRDEVPNG